MTHTRSLVIATHNPNKRDDLINMLTPLGVDLKLIEHYTQCEAEEIGTTFEENALIKARYSFQVTGLPSVADDSGVAMHHLDGAPGIYAARYAMQPDGSKNFKAAFDKLEQTLRQRLGYDRDTPLTMQECATDFVSCLAYVDDVHEHVFHSVLPGYFDFEKRDVPGFGYTPIFVPHISAEMSIPTIAESLAEMGDVARRKISTRRMSVQKFMTWFTSL